MGLWAVGSQLINYQGMLTGTDGKPSAAATAKIVFTIYDGAGNNKWSETHTGVPLVNGQFNVILGSKTTPSTLTADKFSSSEMFLGISVDDKPELTPRQQVLSTPFALKAEQAAKAAHHSNISPVGTIVPYWGTTAPTGWLLCSGQDCNEKGETNFMERHFTAVIVKSGEWFAGTVKELSGVHTQGKTVEEVKENLKEAIEMVIESNIRHFSEFAEDYIEEDIMVAL